MIKKIYIMKENGELLYSKSFLEKEEEMYDDNILIGFFASLVNFGKEAMHTIIQYIDLGHDNKLVLLSKSEERLVGAAIVSSKDDNDLIIKILQNIIEDFITAYSPEYNPNKINREDMESIFKDNLKGKTSHSLIERFIFSWILLGPILVLLIYLTVTITQDYYKYTYKKDQLFTQEEVITQIMPEFVIVALLVLIIAYALPNLLNGYVTKDMRIAVLNSMIYLVSMFILYFNFVEPLFFYVIIYASPSVIFLSIVWTYMGYRLGIKRKIVKN